MPSYNADFEKFYRKVSVRIVCAEQMKIKYILFERVKR